jgi:regulator of sirC expression with transglutaminase-like and TPR domain
MKVQPRPINLICLLAFLLFFTLLTPQPANAAPRADPVAVVKSVLNAPDNRLDYLEAQIAFDRLFDPAADPVAMRRVVERLTAAARSLAGERPSDGVKFDAIRKVVYTSGPWNDHRPFAYDLTDPKGQKPGSQRLSTYLRTRRGNCVSMPILLLIIANRMGMTVNLAAAPLHLFVRYTLPTTGKAYNIEATNGGNLTRDIWYRQNFPISDRAMESGIYLRALNTREGIATMATTVVETLISQGTYQQAVDVADAILKINPRETHVMIKRGSAIGHIIQVEFTSHFPGEALIPPALRPRYQSLITDNANMFAKAEALGWVEEKG